VWRLRPGRKLAISGAPGAAQGTRGGKQENLMSRSMRAFIAITPPAEVIRQLRQLGNRLQEGGLQARWVKPEGIHLTLRFLGDMAPADIGAIGAVMDKVAAQHPPFDLATGALGGFPNRRKARVIWVGVQDPGSLMTALAQDLEACLIPIAGQRERKTFKGHLTLARAKGRRFIDLDAAARSVDAECPEVGFRVQALVLYESRLGPGGAAYHELHQACLGGASSRNAKDVLEKSSNSSTVSKP
jgi:2'-5' RNA ligase